MPQPKKASKNGKDPSGASASPPSGIERISLSGEPRPMPEQNSGSAGSQVDWGVVGSMVGVVFEGIGTVVSASNQNSTITTASGESYTVTNDGSGGYQASPTAGAGAGNGNGNGNGNGWGEMLTPTTLLLAAGLAFLAFR